MMRSMMLIGIREMIAAKSEEEICARNMRIIKSTGLENSCSAPTMCAQNVLMQPPVMLATMHTMSESTSSSANTNGME